MVTDKVLEMLSAPTHVIPRTRAQTPVRGEKMKKLNSNQVQQMAGGAFVALAAAVLTSPFVAVGAFFLQIY